MSVPEQRRQFSFVSHSISLNSGLSKPGVVYPITCDLEYLSRDLCPCFAALQETFPARKLMHVLREGVLGDLETGAQGGAV